MTTERRTDHMARILRGAQGGGDREDTPPLVTRDMLDWLNAAFPHPARGGATPSSQDGLVQLASVMAEYAGSRAVIDRLQQLFDDEAAKRNVRT